MTDFGNEPAEVSIDETHDNDPKIGCGNGSGCVGAERNASTVGVGIRLHKTMSEKNGQKDMLSSMQKRFFTEITHFSTLISPETKHSTANNVLGQVGNLRRNSGLSTAICVVVSRQPPR